MAIRIGGCCGCGCTCCDCTCLELLVTLSNLELTTDGGSTWVDASTALGGGFSWSDPDFRLTEEFVTAPCYYPSYNGGTGTERASFDDGVTFVYFGQTPGVAVPSLVCDAEYLGCWLLSIGQSLIAGAASVLSYPNGDIAGQNLVAVCDPFSLTFTRAGFINGSNGFRATVTITCNDPPPGGAFQAALAWTAPQFTNFFNVANNDLPLELNLTEYFR